MKINFLFATLALVGLTACGATTGTVSQASNFSQVQPNVNISMPKYFFTDEINKSCKVVKDENNFYSSSLYKDWDLTNPDTYKWLEDLQYYNWRKDKYKIY